MRNSLPNDAPQPSGTPLPPKQWHCERNKYFSQVAAVSDHNCGDFYPLFNLRLYNKAIDQITTQLNEETQASLGLLPIEENRLISVVVPVFNEDTTIDWVLRRLASCPVVGQIIVVNDASSDGTANVLSKISDSKNDSFWDQRLPEGIHLVSHPVNQGKGAALRTGFQLATLPWIAIQDADTEYDPLDLLRLTNGAVQNNATVVYGSRYLSRSNKSSPLWHRLGNGVITRLSNLFTGLRLTDVETCYKLIRSDILQSIEPTLKENRFGIEIELTAKLARHLDATFDEQPISYEKRTYAEGKKIGVKDGLRALWCMLRYRLAD